MICQSTKYHMVKKPNHLDGSARFSYDFPWFFKIYTFDAIEVDSFDCLAPSRFISRCKD